MLKYSYLILFFTLFGFIFIFFFGSKLGRKGSFLISLFSNFFSLIIILTNLYTLLKEPFNISYFKVNSTWVKSGFFEISWGFIFDSLSIIMCFIILWVSLVVQMYSYAYLFDDPSLPRFLSYLCLFVFFMLTLVTAENFLVLFLGWEGVGICSYLLISFWNTRVPALKSALKAMLLNRIGDFFLLFAIILIYSEFGSLNFYVVFSMSPFLQNSMLPFLGFYPYLIDLICIFLVLGAFGKSAQLGLHIWLPDAMEGPTPVSALIHAATMVTAGVFLIIRCSPIFELSPNCLYFLVVIGAITAFFSGSCAIVETDIKKIIAYSTCSQLGYMVFACGLSAYNIALFHLFNHAFFKALLFLSAGSIIHTLSNEQNISKMGALKSFLPFTFNAMLIGLLALNAFPFTSGFYSKEAILSIAYISFGPVSLFSYFFAIFTSFLTAFYSYRLLYYVFISEINAPKPVIINVFSENFFTVLALIILIFFSIFSGFIFKDIFLGLGSNFFDFSIYINPENLKLYRAEFLPSSIKIIPLFCSFLGWGVLNPYFFDIFTKFKTPNAYNLLRNEWFFNSFFNSNLNELYLKSFSNIFLTIDNGFLQYVGPKGFYKTFFFLGLQISRAHSGYLHNYFCVIVLNIFFMFFISTLAY